MHQNIKDNILKFQLKVISIKTVNTYINKSNNYLKIFCENLTSLLLESASI